MPRRSPRLAALCAALFVPSASVFAQTSTGAIAGRVVDLITSHGLAANIVLVNAGRTLRSDSAGGFFIHAVPVGTYSLRVTTLGYGPLERTDVVVTPGRTTEVTLALARVRVALEAVQVRAAAFQRPPDVVATQYALTHEEVRRSPGALGDVSRLIQSLPGVITANDQRNDIIARGGSPIENLTLVDNVEVPNLNHFAAQNSTGGPISMLNNDFIEEATFLAGAVPAMFASRLSSVLDVRLREGPKDRRYTEFDFSFAGAGLNTEGHLGRKASYLASARVSYLELLAKPFGLTAIPHTVNASVKVTWDPTPSDKFWLLAIAGEDHIEFGASAEDRADSTTDRVQSAGDRLIVGANWRRLLGSRAVGTLGVSSALGRYRVAAFEKRLQDAKVFENRSTENDVTVKYDVAMDLSALGSAKVGAAWRGSLSHFRVDAPFGNLSPFVERPDRVDPLQLDNASSAGVTSGYVQLARTFVGRVDVTAGTRVEHYQWSGATIVGPRAGINLRLSGRAEVGAAYSRSSQQPPLIYLAGASANRSLDPIRADQVVASFAYRPRADLRLSLEAYEKRYVDYPVALDYPQVSLANTGDVFGVDGLLFPMSSAGRGRALGVEFYVQQRFTGERYGQFALSSTQSRHRAMDGVLRRGAFDTPISATLISGQRFGHGMELSMRASYATGRPVTPHLAGPSSDQNRLIYDVGRLNTERAPAYFRADVRFDRKVEWRGMYITSFVELDNVTNRRNVFLYQWDPKERRLDAVEQLKFFPVGGINIKF